MLYQTLRSISYLHFRGGDSNVLIIGRKAEGKGGLYIMNGKKILFGAAYDELLLFLMRGAY